MKLTLNDIKAVVDTREQRPADLGELRFEKKTLDTGDYSVLGLEQFVRIERKSLPDLIGCIGKERDRFTREMVRLRGFQHKAVVVECYWSDIYQEKWQGCIRSSHVIGSLGRWQLDGIPFILAGPRPLSCQMIQKLLYLSARQYFNIHEAFKGAQEGGDGQHPSN